MTGHSHTEADTRPTHATRRAGSASRGSADRDALRRGLIANCAVAASALLAALVITHAAGVPVRDPKHVTATRLGVTAGLVALLIGVDMVLRAGRRSRRLRPSRVALRSVRRERWTPARVALVAAALLAYHATYLAYRNLKSVVPLVRPHALFDRPLTDLDRRLFAGGEPAVLLHSLLGTGTAAHALSVVYMLFFVLIPVSLAAALVFADPRAGLFYAAALSLNCALAAASYFLLPSIGPFHVDPAAFADLPATPVSRLQRLLVAERAAFLRDPGAAGAAQSIGAFASLHVSIVVTAAGAAHLLGLGRVMKAVAWILAALTLIATAYFGWHYIADDVAGAIIGVAALAAAGLLTGFGLRPGRVARASRPTTSPA